MMTTSNNFSGTPKFLSMLVLALFFSIFFMKITTAASVVSGERLLKEVDDDHLELVGYWLEKGVDVNYRDAHGMSALVLACIGDRESTVRFLLSRDGIEVNSQMSDGGLSALMAACNNGHEKIVEMLLNHPETKNGINAADEHGNTALIYAAAMGHLTIVKMLLKIPGIDFEAEDMQDKTALDRARDFGHEQIVQVLSLKAATSEQ
jgi:ankyrin repeat protein